MKELTVNEEQQTRALVLPSAEEATAQLRAVKDFQATCNKLLHPQNDYGKIPGCGDKMVLLKPGAEKIAKLLSLSEEYEILDVIRDWVSGLIHYEIKCTLRHIGSGAAVCQGVGECNSKESRYAYRWAFPREVPEHLDKSALRQKRGKRRDGKGEYLQYRVPNEDIFDQVNTILKMAKKRAFVDAVLSAGRLSDIFTQDLEDRGGEQFQEPPEPPAEERIKDVTPETTTGYAEPKQKFLQLLGGISHAQARQLQEMAAEALSLEADHKGKDKSELMDMARERLSGALKELKFSASNQIRVLDLSWWQAYARMEISLMDLFNMVAKGGTEDGNNK